MSAFNAGKSINGTVEYDSVYSRYTNIIYIQLKITYKNVPNKTWRY
jgi:hypothetical protein